ncbi:nephrin-like [Daktulosphaira vitifoliae]|uniref:nephrin-like n=1 Tax=Daktulosphaira vitifoliae TaxID=58002 RepID=UPI0021A98AEB|nr:nephrin-like [Daktulosphaira vitifoliae]
MFVTVLVFGCLLATAAASVDSGSGASKDKTAGGSIVYDDKVISTDVEAVAGTVAYLPCNMTPPTHNDRATLVIWYKQGLQGPIYTYDGRKSSANVPAIDHFDPKNPNGAHWADDTVMNGRAFFRVSQQPANLAIQNISEKDGSVYKCRVDFKKSPTRNYKVNLTIILPPDRLSVLNEKGDHIPHYILGPYKEGVTVDITCIANGGRPPPRVTWWQENALLDESFEVLPGRKVRNVLRLERLERHHLNTVFTCQASNNHMVPPISSSVTLDMILRPLSVKMVGENRPISAEIPVNVSCRIVGSKPPPLVTWWKDSVQLSDAKQLTSPDGNVTTSVLTFTPKIQDSDKLLSCRAENTVPDTNTNKHIKTDQNHQISSANVVSSNEWKLSIFHVPVVTLELGKNINGSAIKEGMDVYFECNIKANPWVYRVTWRHNGKPLNNNPSVDTFVSNQSLVLQGVTRDRAGIYTCVGSNQEGDGVSNPVNLDVKFAPVCRPGQETVQGVGRREAAKVVCEVEANPSDHVQYTWRFNNSRETVRLARDRYTEDGPRSTAAYTPQTPLDYGTLMCWASNEYGKQVTPCVYQVIAAGRPDSVENCVVMNQTATTLSVQCQPGFDGGLSQRFVMEVYDRHAQTLAGNVTSDVPVFTVGGLKSGIGFDVSLYAYNARGSSDPIQLQSFTLKSAEKRTAVTPAARITPLIGIIIAGGILSILALACVIGMAIACQRKRCQRRRRDHERSTDESKTAIGSVSDHRSDTSDDGLDKNPDIIPHDNEYLDEEEKAFERLNSNRLYSSRIIDQDPCEQQICGTTTPQPPQQQAQQQFQYGSDVNGAAMLSPQLSQTPISGAVYPNLICPVPPQQQPVSILRHSSDHHNLVQYVSIEQPPRLMLNHHQLHQHYQQQQHPYHTAQMRGPGSNNIGTIGRHNQFQDHSVEIPLLLTPPPAQHMQRESTTDSAMDQRSIVSGKNFGRTVPPSQIVAATRF